MCVRIYIYIYIYMSVPTYKFFHLREKLSAQKGQGGNSQSASHIVRHAGQKCLSTIV